METSHNVVGMVNLPSKMVGKLHFYSSVSPKGEADIHCLAEGNLCSACRRKRAMGLQRADSYR